MQKLARDELLLVLHIEAMDVQTLNGIDISSMLARSLQPDVVPRDARRVNAQAGLPLNGGKVSNQPWYIALFYLLTVS